MQQPENLLLVFMGMIATGKSYLASAWAEQFDLPYYNSDRVRKELAGITPETGQKEEVGKGIYTPEFSRRTYDGLIDLAKKHFEADPDSCVVLDGSYQVFEERERVRKQFSGKAGVVFIHCTCSEQVVRERLAIRAVDPDAVSDGNWKIYQAQKKSFQELKEDEEVILIDTDAPLDTLLTSVNTELMARKRN